MKPTTMVIVYLLLMAVMAYAGEADVEDVKVRMTTKGTYAFDVTVHHADEGWDHYANKWEA